MCARPFLEEAYRQFATTSQLTPLHGRCTSRCDPLFRQAASGWQPMAGPTRAPRGAYAGLSHPMARRAGVRLLHAGRRQEGEPWLRPLVGRPPWAWQPLSREATAHLPALPALPALTQGSWGVQSTAELGDGEAPAQLIAWLGGRDDDIEVVDAPILWWRGSQQRELVDVAGHRVSGPWRVSVHQHQALIGGRADNDPQKPPHATAPFFRVDLSTGSVVERFAENILDVQFWPHAPQPDR